MPAIRGGPSATPKSECPDKSGTYFELRPSAFHTAWNAGFFAAWN